MQFRDRRDAGRMLGEQLAPLAAQHPVVVALPRGGVPVGAEVARLLSAPLEILAVRKLGAPENPELGVGAIAEDGTAVLDESSASAVGMTQAMLDETVTREAAELQRRVEQYRGSRPAVPVSGRTVIVVDDGLATGLSDLAAVHALRKRGADRIVVAVPVGSRESVRTLAEAADEVVCLVTPRVLFGVGLWYEDFSAVSDEEVLALLEEARARAGDGGSQPERTV
jgi:predicted phosphoribosyltransferase